MTLNVCILSSPGNSDEMSFVTRFEKDLRKLEKSGSLVGSALRHRVLMADKSSRRAQCQLTVFVSVSPKPIPDYWHIKPPKAAQSEMKNKRNYKGWLSPE